MTISPFKNFSMKKIVLIITVWMVAFIPLTIYADQDNLGSAQQCATLTCVREHIDSIDAQLVDLIGRRLSYVQRAGELKGSATAIHDQTREDKILKKVGLEAEKLGYPASIAQAVFRTILEQANQYEKNIHENLLRVGVTGDYPPLTYYNMNTGQFSGSDIDKAVDLGGYLGKKVVFVKTSWSNLSADLMAGKFDIAMGGIADSPERREKFLLSQPVLKDGKIPLVRCDEVAQYASLDKINQPQVRVVENIGGTNEKFAKQFLPDAKLILVENNNLVFDYLLKNQADVMITDRVEALYRQKTMRGLCAVNPDHLLTTFNKVYLLPKADTKLLEQVNDWLNATRQN
jgi:cyclohexadienyl dehydratase